jgi:hypothetical protein
VVDEVLKARPATSDRQIALQTGVSHPTVAKERAKLVEAGFVERTSTRTDTKGRNQPATKPLRRGPIRDDARKAAWGLRKSLERAERVLADDRFAANRAAVGSQMRSHLEYAVVTCREMLQQLEVQTS